MKKKEIIEVLKKHSVNYPFGNAICQSDFESIATELSGQEDKVQKIDEWINVKDKLPKENTNVIVYDNGDIYEAFLNKDGIWIPEIDHIKIIKITHWIPLLKVPIQQEDKINDEDKIMKDVISLLIDRRRMAAIKVYWDLHGCGLKEAKIAVDKIEDELKKESKIKPYKQRLTDK